MTTNAQKVIAEIQNVLTRNNAALFFGPDYEGELWIDGFCAGHVTHGDNCELVEGSVCETATSSQHRERKGGAET